MKKYAINHNTQRIHRQEFSTNNCDTTELVNLEYSDDDSYVENLINNDGFQGCYYCYKSQYKG